MGCWNKCLYTFSFVFIICNHLQQVSCKMWPPPNGKARIHARYLLTWHFSRAQLPACDLTRCFMGRLNKLLMKMSALRIQATHIHPYLNAKKEIELLSKCFFSTYVVPVFARVVRWLRRAVWSRYISLPCLRFSLGI